MEFDPTNKIVKLCAEGMALEHKGKPEEAFKIFQQAWTESKTEFEKFTAAHYVARHQTTVHDKLIWDKKALDSALKITDQEMEGSFPSLYLNIAKCYENLKDFKNALDNYRKALSFTNFLKDDGYGKMIKAGIEKGIERTNF